jgi:Activator of Hsp90 ATPase homolog 1-like protein
VAGWWTTRNQTSGTVGEVDQMWFPDAPMAWELRVDEAVPGKVLARHCVGGPPQWIGTDVRFALEPAPQGGTRILLDHTGFAQVDEMFRIVTLGWAQMLLHLKQYLDSGQPAPFFSF